MHSGIGASACKVTLAEEEQQYKNVRNEIQTKQTLSVGIPKPIENEHRQHEAENDSKGGFLYSVQNQGVPKEFEAQKRVRPLPRRRGHQNTHAVTDRPRQQFVHTSNQHSMLAATYTPPYMISGT
jgi:hypothetical protein